MSLILFATAEWTIKNSYTYLDSYSPIDLICEYIVLTFPTLSVTESNIVCISATQASV